MLPRHRLVPLLVLVLLLLSSERRGLSFPTRSRAVRPEVSKGRCKLIHLARNAKSGAPSPLHCTGRLRRLPCGTRAAGRLRKLAYGSNTRNRGRVRPNPATLRSSAAQRRVASAPPMALPEAPPLAHDLKAGTRKRRHPDYHPGQGQRRVTGINLYLCLRPVFELGASRHGATKRFS